MERIEPESMVTIRYTMVSHLPDGTEKPRAGETTSFIYRVERQVPSLESALSGRRIGDRFVVHVPAEELYGDRDPALIREIPTEGLIKQRLREGQYYRQIRRSCLVSFKVLELRPDTVLADFNKPMAGIRVTLEVEVIAVRRAEREEISAALEAEHKKSIGCG